MTSKEIEVVISENAKVFTDPKLTTLSVLIFLNTKGDVLNDQQQVAMERNN